MYRRTPLAVLVALVALLTGASAAVAKPVAHTPDSLLHQGPPAYEVKYLKAHERVVKKLGAQAAGRNFVIDGALSKRGVAHAANRERIVNSTERLALMLNPPEAETAVAPVETTTTYSAPTTTSTATGGYAIPEYIVQCESGGDYNAVNPSGAYGAYQIMPGTAAGYGCDLSTPEGQDQCAAEIYAAEGAAPWECG